MGKLYAQQYPFVQYTISDGLSSPNVTCFAKDSQGFTWIGTDNGLNRFDGEHIQVFGTEDGLSNDHISKLCQVGELIIGATTDGQLFKAQRNSIELLNASAEELSEIFELKFRRDTLWIAAMKGLYTWVNDSLERHSYFKNQDTLAVSGIEFDSSGSLFICTHHYGVFKRKGKANFFRVPMPDIRGILDFAVLPEGNLYLAGHHFLLNPDSIQVKQINPFNDRQRNWSNVLLPDGNWGLWIGSDETGLYHYNVVKNELLHFGQNQGLEAKSLTAILLDLQGVLWIGTNGKGFYRLFTRDLKIHNDFKDANVIGIHKLDENDIWASTLTGELFQVNDSVVVSNYMYRNFNLDADYDQYRNLPYQTSYKTSSVFVNSPQYIPKPDYTVWSMQKGKKGNWVGMNYALYHNGPAGTRMFNRDSTGFPSDVIYSLDYKADSLWVGLELGAVCLANQQMVWRYKSPDSIKNSTKIIFRDSRQRVWMGGNKLGLSKKVGDYIKPAILDEDWQKVHITDILEDQQGRIWVSSDQLGIAVLDGKSCEFLPTDNGLPSGKVMSMALYQNQLVVGTDHGVYTTWLKNSNPSRCQFQRVDVSGKFNFPCNRNAAQADEKGRFWVGTTSGVLQFNASTPYRRVSPPQPYLRSAQLLYESTMLDSFTNKEGEIIIPYSKNGLRFKVGSVYFLNQKNVTYSYRLIGSSQGWSNANKSTDITFDNLSPGTYTLAIKGKGEAMAWSEPSELLIFTVETPFWLSLWFYAIIVIVIVVLVLVLIKLRTQQLKMRNKALEDYAAEKNREIKAKNLVLEDQYLEKEALLQEIHHRVKNNLQIIISLLRLQQRRVEDQASQEVLNQSIGRIKTMSLIHQNLYQTDNLARTNFKTYLNQLMEHIMANFQNISEIDYELEGDEIELGTESAIPLALIAHEWVNNIYKHAFPNKKGRVNIQLQHQGLFLCMTIADNGIGISKTEFMASKKSLGAKIIRTLSSQLDADLNIERIPEGGTELSLKLKVKG